MVCRISTCLHACLDSCIILMYHSHASFTSLDSCIIHVTWLMRHSRHLRLPCTHLTHQHTHTNIRTRNTHTHTHKLMTIHYNTLQHFSTHCNTLQHTATQCKRDSRKTKGPCPQRRRWEGDLRAPLHSNWSWAICLNTQVVCRVQRCWMPSTLPNIGTVYAKVYCIVLQCVAVCCSTLQ